MKTIKVQLLSKEKFAKYGEYQNLLDDKSLAEKSIFPYRVPLCGQGAGLSASLPVVG